MCSPFCGLKKKKKNGIWMDMLTSCSLAHIQMTSLSSVQCSLQAQSEWGNIEMLCSTLNLPGHTKTSTAYINQIQPHTGLYKQKYGQQVKGSGCSPVLSTYVAASGALWFTFGPQHSSDKNKSAARPAADYCNA